MALPSPSLMLWCSWAQAPLPQLGVGRGDALPLVVSARVPTASGSGSYTARMLQSAEPLGSAPHPQRGTLFSLQLGTVCQVSASWPAEKRQAKSMGLSTSNNHAVHYVSMSYFITSSWFLLTSLHQFHLLPLPTTPIYSLYL